MKQQQKLACGDTSRTCASPGRIPRRIIVAAVSFAPPLAPPPPPPSSSSSSSSWRKEPSAPIPPAAARCRAASLSSCCLRRFRRRAAESCADETENRQDTLVGFDDARLLSGPCSLDAYDRASPTGRASRGTSGITTTTKTTTTTARLRREAARVVARERLLVARLEAADLARRVEGTAAYDSEWFGARGVSSKHARSV